MATLIKFDSLQETKMTKNIIGARFLSGNKTNKKQPLKTEKGRTDQLKTRKKRGRYKNLGFLTANKMIQQFLTCDRIVMVEERRLKYSKNELAKQLNVSMEEFERLRKDVSYKNLASKITLPLAVLYCSTKWAKEKSNKEL
jgi:hypothetical protein